MKLLKLKPCDNTFFRDGKVFEKGYNNTVQSKNMPYPSVFSGAIFTALLTSNEHLKKEFMKNPSVEEKKKILKIGQVYLYNERTRDIYIPAPKDIFRNKYGEIYFGKFDDMEEGMSSLPYKKVLMPPKVSGVKRVSKEFINIKNIYREYKKKSYLGMDLIHEDEIFKKNYKVGVGTDYNKRMVKEDLLYRIEQTEFESDDWSFIVEYDIKYDYLKSKYDIGIENNLSDLNNGYLKLGGENKVCKYENIENKYISRFHKSIEEGFNMESDLIKIIFTTDMYFNDDSDRNCFFKKRVIGMSNDKPIYIGGFDIKENKPKVMFKGYEAGAIFLVRKNNDSLEDIKAELNKLIGDSVYEGFGKYIIMGGE